MGIVIAKNKIKTFFIVGIIAVLLYGVIYYISESMGYGSYSIAIAGLVSGGVSFFSYWFSDTMVLKMNGAKPASGEELKLLTEIITPICKEAGIPMPKLYVVEEKAPNAFATGRNYNHSAVAVTRGLLDMMDKEELSGVIAHEVAHIKNYDILLQTVASIMIGAILIATNIFSRSFLYRRNSRDDNNNGNALFAILGLICVIIAPIASQLLRFSLSRNREYLADATAADITKKPMALASALNKLGGSKIPLLRANDATAPMYIDEPIKAATGKKIAELFSTHPPIEKRIEELRKMQ